ncbi:MAG: UDP-N-acetylmuramoyl-tripeptide--D-alanyl-D-alanine ligase [Propionicimonas sp.]
MDELTASQLAGMVGGRLVGDPAVVVGPDVVIDSRLATEGALFVALPGDRTDGHAFVPAAVAAGAGAVLVSRPVDTPAAQVVVDDVSQALGWLATAVVARAREVGLRSVGITGSSGKTSTKDLLAAVLRVGGSTVAPQGSFNNEIGVPLTACGVDAHTRFLIAEMGARGQGHVAALCRIVPPDVGVVLNVGHAHLGEFGSVPAIALAKGELVEALGPDGWAVLNADDASVLGMASRTSARIATWSLKGEPSHGDLRVWAEAITADEWQRHSFTLRAAGAREASVAVSLQVSGAHQVGNALAAATVGLIEGLDPEPVAQALSSAVAVSRWRMEIVRRSDGVVVVNDAYNANPDSMRAALEALAGMRRPSGRLVAVLGDMLELGIEAAAQHEAIGELAAQLGIDEVVAVGEFAADIVAGARRGGAEAVAVLNPAAALATALGLVSPPDVVLVKASRGLALESVAERLASADPAGRGEGVTA